MFSVEAMPRSWVDWVGVAVTGSVVTTLVVLGLYGSSLGFLQTKSYLDANEWVALGAGLLGAGCALYLLMEFTGRLAGRQVFGICLISALFSVFAVTKGVPAAVTQFYGHEESVRFVVSGFDWGGKRCSGSVVAKNPGFEDFVMCVNYLDGTPRVGGTIEVRGLASGWGIVRERIVVR